MSLAGALLSHFVNPLVAATGAPPIPAAQGWIAAYDGAMGPPLNLAQAVPGDPPPPVLLAALARAAGDGATAAYGPIVGDPALRRALVADMDRLYGIAGTGPGEGDVAITAGCNEAFFAAMIALARAGDEVILPAPWYFNHQMTLDMLGIVAVPLPCRAQAGFVPDVADARARLSAKTRAIVLVSPNNPTGAIYPPASIAAFKCLADEAGVTLVVDETYRDFLPPGGAPHDLFAGGGWRRNFVQLYSFSKAYAIPGYRLGALVAGTGFVAEAAKVLDSMQICAPRVGQIALAETIAGLVGYREANRDELGRRAAAFRGELAGAPGWEISSIGAYFAYVRHPAAGPAIAVAEDLARRAGVIALPGSWFGPGQDDHLRFAFANVTAEALGGLGRRLSAFGS